MKYSRRSTCLLHSPQPTVDVFDVTVFTESCDIDVIELNLCIPMSTSVSYIWDIIFKILEQITPVLNFLW